MSWCLLSTFVDGANESAREDDEAVGDDVANDGPGWVITWEQGDLPVRTRETHVRIEPYLWVLSHQHIFSHFPLPGPAGRHKS